MKKSQYRVGLYLSRYRELKHLTKKEMAAKIGVSREYYSKLEHSKEQPSVDLLQTICSTTGTLMEILLREKKNGALNGDLEMMCELCVQLGESERTKALKLMKRLTAKEK